MADEKQHQVNEQESEDDATEFLADETESVVPEDVPQEDEAGPDLPSEKQVKVKQNEGFSEKLKSEPKAIGAPIPGKFDKLKSFYVECKRVLRVTKKPSRDEFKTIVKISAIGMGIIGAVGFLVHFVKEIFF